MSEHSRLPWRQVNPTLVRDADGKMVGYLSTADATLIVRAVNSHYELVEALERARRDIFNDIVLKEIDAALSLAKGEGHGK